MPVQRVAGKVTYVEQPVFDWLTREGLDFAEVEQATPREATGVLAAILSDLDENFLYGEAVVVKWITEWSEQSS